LGLNSLKWLKRRDLRQKGVKNEETVSVLCLVVGFLPTVAFGQTEWGGITVHAVPFEDEAYKTYILEFSKILVESFKTSDPKFPENLKWTVLIGAEPEDKKKVHVLAIHFDASQKVFNRMAATAIFGATVAPKEAAGELIKHMYEMLQTLKRETAKKSKSVAQI